MVNRDKYRYYAQSKQQRTKALDILLEQGFHWHGSKEYKSGEQIEASFSYFIYPIIDIGIKKMYLRGRAKALVFADEIAFLLFKDLIHLVRQEKP